MKFDFGGYATKNGLKCGDGRIIQKDAFKHHDGKKVPLVWAHVHDNPENVLGHAILENREDGVYAYCLFNDSPSGIQGKTLVSHGDVEALSIFANNLKQTGNAVTHGNIKEVSLVLSGANPGALIDNICIQHSDDDGYHINKEAAFIYSGEDIEIDVEPLEHADDEGDSSASDDKTVKEVFDSMNEEQKTVVYAMIGAALMDDEDEDDQIAQSDLENNKGESILRSNIFENKKVDPSKKVLSHDDMKNILADARKCGSFKEAFLAHDDVATYGIENIEILFPDAQTVRTTPDLVKRDDGWVSPFLNALHKTPFSRVKSRYADLTEDAARAKGYIKATQKLDEVFPVFQRITTPQTIYKRQKLDRDDIIDITDFDVVVWIRSEMRVMLNEEIARAALVGDGRSASAPDKINEANIRPVWTDDELYAPKVNLAPLTGAETITKWMDDILRARTLYKGSGNPNLYTTSNVVTDMLLVRDQNGRRIYPTIADIKAALRVNEIIEVDVMEGLTRTVETVDRKLVAIMFNPKDYTVGADRGGQVNNFDDFDIDFNQYKYLIETRCSGALTLPKSAVVFESWTEEAAG